MLRFSRRSVLAATAALAAIPFAQWARATGYGGGSRLRTRYDAESTEGRAMLRKFERAVRLMRERPTADPLSWRFQWYTHWVPDYTTKNAEIAKLPENARPMARALWNTCLAHDKKSDENLFLPWHRVYVFHFERIVRKVLDDDDFTLPYWDLTNPVRRALPEPFLHPATDENPLYYAARKPEVNAGKPVDFQSTGTSPLDPVAMDQETYAATDVTQGMCMSLDKGLHGSVHVLIGNEKGMGTVQWAANDPIFWVLHSAIDRLWISWLAAGRSNPADEGWLNTEFAFADENGRVATTLVRDSLDAEAMGYRYERLAPIMAVAMGEIEPEAAGAPPADAAGGGAPQGNRAPGPTGAARAAPQAPAAPAAQVQSHGRVNVGQAPVQVTLQARPMTPAQRAEIPVPAPSGGGADRAAPPTTAAPPPLQAQAPRPAKLYIVIRNLQARAQPGVLYDVFATVTVAGTPPVTQRLGSINFFDAVGGGHAPGMTMQQSFVSFEVTNTLPMARAPGAKIEITVAPVGQAAGNAAPSIGNISLVEKPA